MVSFSFVRVVHVAVAVTVLVFLAVVVDFFKPNPMPIGPLTLQEELELLFKPEPFSFYAEFERLQNLYGPAIMGLKWPDYDPNGQIDTYLSHETILDEATSFIEPSRTQRHILIADIPLPRPAAIPHSCKPSSITHLLLAFSMVTFLVVTVGTLILKSRLVLKTACSPAHQVAPHAPHATRPLFKSSGETRRCWAFPPPKRARRFSPLLLSVDELYL
ncbi:hypothetical protein DFH07DRAFT_404484 [Mycena maculata]|uniref:Uncharacterized protein n=1 Tax=Mycena maculata TaxID=230809 RepID=A0AAD7JEL6_9AGAR|nr:hypothetical protein DFH07DRAFT_404484 [Mycena maculata]